MDAADIAGEAREAFELGLLRRARLPVRADDGIGCEDCGQDIPEARRRAVPGCPCCVECQEIRDKRSMR